MRALNLLRHFVFVCCILIMSAEVRAQEDEASGRGRQSQKRAGNISSQVVFPPREEMTAARDRSLRQFKVSLADARQPNVVLILADDLGYGDLGFQGSTSIPTPHIDKLATQGVRFSNAYVTAASCSPSRAGLLTGCYQQRFGFEFNTAGAAVTERFSRGLDPAAVTLADVLKRAGYKTGMFGKWHLGTRPHLHPMSRGFEQFYGFLAGAHSFLPVERAEPDHSTLMRGRTPLKENDYLTDAIARETVAFINNAGDSPFFAYVPFNAVHTPIEATPAYLSRFSSIQDPRQRAYNAMTSALDDAVGSILKAISDRGLEQSTLVVFVNDNGGPIYTGVQSNGDLKLGKLFLFEGGIRVPMIIKLPGVIGADTTYEPMVSTLDLFPTIGRLAGIDVSPVKPMDGVDLIPFLAGSLAGVPHEALFWSNGPNAAMRLGNWKFVQSRDSTWLFDLSKDPGEKNDLSGGDQGRCKQMQRQIKDWRESMPAPAWSSKPQRRIISVDGKPYQLNI
jgi:arylsulfatase A-like enzyme